MEKSLSDKLFKNILLLILAGFLFAISVIIIQQPTGLNVTPKVQKNLSSAIRQIAEKNFNTSLNTVKYGDNGTDYEISINITYEDAVKDSNDSLLIKNMYSFFKDIYDYDFDKIYFSINYQRPYFMSEIYLLYNRSTVRKMVDNKITTDALWLDATDFRTRMR